MKKLVVVDFRYLYYKYKFAYEANKLETKMCGKRDITLLYYPISEIRSMSKNWSIDVAVCFDCKGEDGYERNEEDSTYKQGRVEMLTQEDRDNIDEIEEILINIGIKVYKVIKKEADDLVNSVIRKEKYKYDIVEIHTADSDLLQLVDDKTNVSLYRTGKGNILIEKCVFEETLVAHKIFKAYIPYNMVLAYKATVGDPGDSIKGIAGFGPAAFKKWINQYEGGINCEFGADKEYVDKILKTTLEEDKYLMAKDALDKVALRVVDIDNFENMCTREIREVILSQYNMHSLI